MAGVVVVVLAVGIHVLGRRRRLHLDLHFFIRFGRENDSAIRREMTFTFRVDVSEKHDFHLRCSCTYIKQVVPKNVNTISLFSSSPLRCQKRRELNLTQNKIVFGGQICINIVKVSARSVLNDKNFVFVVKIKSHHLSESDLRLISQRFLILVYLRLKTQQEEVLNVFFLIDWLFTAANFVSDQREEKLVSSFFQGKPGVKKVQ